MSCKRPCSDNQDPEYENNVSKYDQKRLKVIEKDNKQATVHKIEQIIRTQFEREVKAKEDEIGMIEDRLYCAMKMLEQLRICIIASYYSLDMQNEVAVSKGVEYQPPIHPTVKKLIGKAPKNASLKSTADVTLLPGVQNSCVSREMPTSSVRTSSGSNDDKLSPRASPSPALHSPQKTSSEGQSMRGEAGNRAARFKIKKTIVVGNVSKYIPVDKREEHDQSTHKWMVYVRGSKEEPLIEKYVKKVWFFLHPSYRPNDLVEVNQPPFHLTRRGWGEFPVRAQLHFHDARNKRVDIIHTLKLDKTYTGLQTLGAETVVDVLIYKPMPNCTTTTKIVERSPAVPPNLGGIVIAEETTGMAEEEERQFQDKVISGISPRRDFTRMRNVDRHLTHKERHQSPRSNNESHVSGHLTPVNVDLVKSEHSYQAECPSAATGTASPVKEPPQSGVANITTPLKRVIKQEPLGDYEIEDQARPCTGRGTAVTATTANSISPTTEVKLEPLSILKPATHSIIPNSEQRSVLSNPSPASGKVTLVQTPEGKPSGHVPEASSKKPNPTTSTSSSNGLVTFVKCVDRNGGLFLVPLATFLKLNPNINAGMLQHSTTSLSPHSLLRASPSAPGSSGAGTLSDSSSGTAKTVAGPPQKPLVVLSGATNLPDEASSTKGLVVNPEAALSKGGGGGRDSGLKNVAGQKNNCVKPVILHAQNSVSLLSGVPKLKMSGGSSTVNNASPKAVLNNSLVRCASGAAGGASKTAPPDFSEMRFLVNNHKTMKDIVRCVIRHYPLFAANPDRCIHPYCASSFTEFLNWNVGKRHAAEWQRAKAVRGTILELLKGNENWKDEDVWTTKQLLLWCRQYGYSPVKTNAELEASINDSAETVQELVTCTAEHVDLLEALSSENGALKSQECGEVLEDEEEIDVVSVEDVSQKSFKKSPEKTSQKSALTLLSSACGEFVQDTVRQIGLRLLPEEIIDGVVAPAAEEVMLSAAKQFMDDILRMALSAGFKCSTSKRYPSDICAKNVFDAITEFPQCDFLTNRFLGTKLHRHQFLQLSDVKL